MDLSSKSFSNIYPYLPKEITELIYEKCWRIQHSDFNTIYNFTMINKHFYYKYKKDRERINKHYEALDDLWKYTDSDLKFSIGKECNRVSSIYTHKDIYGKYAGGAWIVINDIECPICEYHTLKMKYVMNRRDIDIFSYQYDDEEWIHRYY